MTDQKCRILYVTDGFHIGGAELKLLEMLRQIDRKKYDIHLISFWDEGPLKASFQSLGFPLLIMDRKSRFDGSIPIRLYQYLRKHRLHIVQSLLFYPDVMAAFIGWFAGVPKRIAWETASHNDLFFHPWRRRVLYQLASLFMTDIVTVSAEGKKSILEHYLIASKKIKIIPYGIDLQRYGRSGGETALKARSGHPQIGVVARLDYIKGHCYLLDALALLKREIPGLRCMLVGDGPLREELEKQCEQLDLTDNVQFLGFRDDIPDLLTQMDIFVLPSLSEGMPNVILEAMAAKIPVVASRVGGIPEMIDHGVTGMLVPAKDAAGLHQSLRTLIQDPVLYQSIAENALKNVTECHSLTKQMKDFEFLYLDVYP